MQDQLQNVQQIQASLAAFAAILSDGTVVAWGFEACGGDSSSVQDQLKNVLQIQATTCAFAAILEDGSMVTWEDEVLGGDSSSVQDQPHMERLLPSWQMGLSSRGAMQAVEVIAIPCKIS